MTTLATLTECLANQATWQPTILRLITVSLVASDELIGLQTN